MNSESALNKHIPFLIALRMILFPTKRLWNIIESIQPRVTYTHSIMSARRKFERELAFTNKGQIHGL